MNHGFRTQPYKYSVLTFSNKQNVEHQCIYLFEHRLQPVTFIVDIFEIEH